MEGGLDTEKIAALERWGVGLQADPRPEVAAAGRAIVMLIDEIERLNVLVWGPTLYPQEASEARADESRPGDLLTTLRRRLRLHRRGTRAGPATDGAPPAVVHTPSTGEPNHVSGQAPGL